MALYEYRALASGRCLNEGLLFSVYLLFNFLNLSILGNNNNNDTKTKSCNDCLSSNKFNKGSDRIMNTTEGFLLHQFYRNRLIPGKSHRRVQGA